MTPLEKQQIWDALYKCTRNGYPGATYETYDSPKDPRVRGGRYPWKRAQLRDIYEQLVKWGDLNEPTAAWRELLKYKTKIAPACLRNIFQSITFGPPPTPTYQIAPSSGFIPDGGTLPFTVNTTNVPDGTVLYWTILPIAPTPAVPADFVSGVMNGSFTVNSNAGGAIIFTVNNTLYTPNTDFAIQVRTGSIAGPIVDTSGTFTIDRGQAPLRTVWDNIINVPVANVNSVSDWQTFYDAGTPGSFATTFSAVAVTGNIVDLYPTSPVPSTLQPFTFSSNQNLIEFIDFHGIISILDFGCFENTFYLSYVYLPGHPSSPILSIGDLAFFQSGLSAIAPPLSSIGNFPSVTDIYLSAFEDSQLWGSLSFPAATTIGLNAFNNLQYIGYLDLRSFINTGSLLITDYINNFVTVGIILILDQSWQQQLLNVTGVDYASCPIVPLINFTQANIIFYNGGIEYYLGGTNSGTQDFIAGASDQILFTVGGPDFAVYTLSYYYEITGVGITQADFTAPNPISGPVFFNGSLNQISILPDLSGVGKSFTFSVYQGIDNTGPLVISDTYNII